MSESMNESEAIRRKTAQHKVRLCHWLTGAYALWRRFATLSRRHSRKETKRVLIFFSARIGDAILFLDTFRAYKRLYSPDEGYELVFACRKEVKVFLETVGEAEGVRFIEVDRERIMWSFTEFVKAVRSVGSKKYDIVIIPRLVSVIEYVFAYCLPAPKVYTVCVEGNESKSSMKEQIFVRGGCTDTLYVDQSMRQQNRFWALFNEISGEQNKTMVPRLPEFKSNIEVPGKYCVFAVSTTDNLTKCWPIERFVEVIDHVVSVYGLDVCLSGAAGDLPAVEHVMASVERTDKVHCFAGNTSLTDWFELVRGARLVVSIDSASIHVAAATGTPSICVGGQWEGECYVPYDPDVVREDDALPVAVRGEKLPCFYCVLSKGGRLANPDCRKAVEQETPYPCMLAVSTESVIDAVDSELGGVSL